MEISLNIESELFIEFSFLWFTLPLIDVHDIPLLVDLAVSWVDHDVSVLSIDSTLDVKYFIILDISYESTISSPQLPPS